MKGLIDYFFIVYRYNSREGMSTVTLKFITWDRIAHIDAPSLFEASELSVLMPNYLL